MPAVEDHSPLVRGASPLAVFIRKVREENEWTYDDLSHNARERGLKASAEVFRKAATDGHSTPLRPLTVRQLAAGLHSTEQRIRDLDAQRWSNTAPVASGIDPELAATLADLEPAEVQRVIDFARGIQSGR